MMKPETKVRVIYPDNTERETTVRELREQLKDETKNWKNWFFGCLEDSGYALGAFAEYKLVSES